MTPNRLITSPTTVPSTPTAGVPHSWGKTGMSAVMTVGGASAWSLTNSDPFSGSGTFSSSKAQLDLLGPPAGAGPALAPRPGGPPGESGR